MKYTLFNGQEIGKNAEEFFEKLGNSESSGNYKKSNNPYGFMGRYQLGEDIFEDLGWYKDSTKNKPSKKNPYDWIGDFSGYIKSKWNVNTIKDFLNSPSAQDDSMMQSLPIRLRYIKSLIKTLNGRTLDSYICQKITISKTPIITTTSGKPHEDQKEKLKLVLKRFRERGMGNPLGKSYIITTSGVLAGAHLAGQGGVAHFLASDGKKLPIDGYGTCVLSYLVQMGGHDLSVIIGYKDKCDIAGKVVVKNDSFKDEVILKDEMNKGTNKTNDNSTPSGIPKKEEKGIYEFKGQKYEEVWENEFYKQDISGRKSPPIAGYVEAEEAVIKRLEEKFENPDLYGSDYIKYIESKLGRKVLEENKVEINVMLALYDKATSTEKRPGNIVRQYGFDVLRGRNETNEPLRIQDVAYYIYYYPIPKKGQLETLEYVFSKFSAKYVKFPDVHYTENKETGEYQIAQIAEIIKDVGKRKEEPVIKYKLPEKYDKYMEGVKDMDEIILRIPKKEKQYFHKMRSENLLRGLEMAGEHKKSFSVDENSVRKYPLARRFLDNLLIEFVKVETGFKEEKENKDFDGHGYRDSNILRNYLLWYDENFGRIELPSPEGGGMYAKLEKLGKDIRITTMLDIWINSKEKNKLKHVREIHNLIIDNYGDYTDKKDFDRDKEIITGHFSDIKELRDYSAGKDSMNLYSFYKEFYDLKNIIQPSNELYVNENCILKCTLGNGMSRINVNRDGVILRGGKPANIKDKNILPFKSCKAASSCKPELLDAWEKNTDTQVGGKPALLDISTIKCKYGGIISIDDSGQKKINSSPVPASQSTGNTGQSTGKSNSSSSVGTAKTTTVNTKLSKKEVDCGYRSLLEICVSLNKNFMQTPLKKECQMYRKYKKDHTALENERRTLYKKINNIKNEFVVGDLGEKLKQERIKNAQKELDNFIKKNEEKAMIAGRGSSDSKKRELMSKISVAMYEASSKAMDMSVPKKDIKKVFKNYGYTACDYDKRKFYQTSIFGSIVYGYLNAAMGETISKKTQEEMEKDIKKREEEERRKNTSYPNYKLPGYEIYADIQKKEAEKSTEIKGNTEVQVLFTIGEELYKNTQEIPTGTSILAKIRGKVSSVIKCPFEEVERQGHHGEKPVSSDKAVANNQGSGNNSEQQQGNKSTSGNQQSGKSSTTTNSQTPVSNKGQQQQSSGDTNKSSSTQVNKTAEKPKSDSNNSVVCSEDRCPNVGVNGIYTFVVERVKESDKATLAKFYVLDPNDERLSKYDGYIIEREGPDEIRSGRKKRVVAGVHNLKWRYRPAMRHRYWAPHIYSEKISADRAILMHPGQGRGWSVGCLIWAESVKGYTTSIEGSQGFAEKIKKFIHQVENTSYEEVRVLETGKHKTGGSDDWIDEETEKHPTYKKYQGKSLKKIKIKIINNF